MKSFLQFIDEEKHFEEGINSLWCIGTTSDQFDRKSGKFVKENNFAWPMYMTRSITSAIDYAKSKKVQKGTGASRIAVVGKVLKPDIKVFDLEDDADFAKSSFKPQMAELFRLADPYFSFTTQDSLRMRKSYVPDDVFNIHTIAKNFIRYINGKFTTKNGTRLTSENWVKFLSKPMQTKPIDQESYATFKAEYDRVRDQFNATHSSDKHMTSIPAELTPNLEKYVNAYISGFQTVNDLVVGDPDFMKEFDQIPTYADILQYALFKDIFQHDFDGYHVAEFAKASPKKADCMALFSAGIFEPLASMHAVSAEDAFDRSDVKYDAEQSDTAIKSVLRQVEPNYIDWY